MPMRSRPTIRDPADEIETERFAPPSPWDFERTGMICSLENNFSRALAI
jgi:hypothetical protein